MESSSSSSSSFTEDSLSRFFGLGDTDGGGVETEEDVIFRGSRGVVLLDDVDEGTGTGPFVLVDGGVLLDIGCSGAGEAGPAPLGMELSFARAAKALFMTAQYFFIYSEESIK